jgi:hypothetical protein
MEFVANLAEIFAIALAATVAVALLTRLSGSKPDKRRMFAIAIGLIVAQAIQLQWSLSTALYALTVGTCVASCLLISRFSARSRREA